MQIKNKLEDLSLRYKLSTNPLLEEYLERGYWFIKSSEALDLDDTQVMHFVITAITTDQIYCSLFKPDLLSSDITFMNIRGIGTIWDAIKVLPTIRTSAIHLAPFFEAAFDVIYAIESTKDINPQIVSEFLLELGFSPKEQLKLFIDFAHGIGKIVGFDLEPHVSQFAKTVLDNPQLFRWVRIDPYTKTRLYNGIKMEEMVTPKMQQQLAREVQKKVKRILVEYNINKLEGFDNQDLATKVKHEITQELIKYGYWTIPSHTWNGLGLPRFVGYDEQKNSPVWEYLNIRGEDSSEHAFHLVTPYAFVDGLGVNNYPPDPSQLKYNEKVIKHFINIFVEAKEEYGFDFVRLDYADHILDAVDEDDNPITDRMTPYVVKKLTSTIKHKYPDVRIFAERMDYDIADYHKMGVNLILGREVFDNFDDTKYLEFYFELQNSRNITDDKSICFAIDTHDSENPIIRGKNLTDIYGPEATKARYFLHAFTNIVPEHKYRPRYELVGTPELSRGTYRSCNKYVTIRWGRNDDFFIFHSAIESLRKLLRSIYSKYTITRNFVMNEYVYWIVKLERPRHRKAERYITSGDVKSRREDYLLALFSRKSIVEFENEIGEKYHTTRHLQLNPRDIGIPDLSPYKIFTIELLSDLIAKNIDKAVAPKLIPLTDEMSRVKLVDNQIELLIKKPYDLFLVWFYSGQVLNY